MSIWEELGVSGGTAILVLIALYFIIKWAVRNGIKEAYTSITGEKTAEDKYWKNYWGNYYSGKETEKNDADPRE